MSDRFEFVRVPPACAFCWGAAGMCFFQGCRTHALFAGVPHACAFCMHANRWQDCQEPAHLGEDGEGGASVSMVRRHAQDACLRHPRCLRHPAFCMHANPLREYEDLQRVLQDVKNR